MRTLICGIVIGAALLVAPFSSALANAYKAFGKWNVYCTNGLNCDMQYYDEARKSAISSFKLHRDAGPNTPISAEFAIADNVIPNNAKGLSVSFEIDKDHAISVAPSWIHYDKDQSAWTITGDLAGLGLVDAIKKGHDLHVIAKTADKTVDGVIPLTGVAASLLYMDDAQNRVGHRDALSAKGDKPPGAAPPIADIHHFADFPEKMRGIFADNGECGQLDEGMLASIGAFVHHLSGTDAIYAAPCGPPGAYNAPFVLYYQSEDFVTQMPFPVMMPEGPGAMSTAFNLNYDYKTLTFTSFYKGRGLGDCGSYYTWKLTDGGDGKTLVLMEQRDKEDCDGNYAGGPEKWPELWPPQ